MLTSTNLGQHLLYLTCAAPLSQTIQEVTALICRRCVYIGESRTMLCCVQSKSPQAVQPHLGKCFDGIRRLEFGGDDPKSPDILAMVSAEGEKVPLGKNLKVCSS